MLSLAAAPDGPASRPQISRRAQGSLSDLFLLGSRLTRWLQSLWGLVILGCRESQPSSTETVSPTRTHNQSFMRVGFQFRTDRTQRQHRQEDHQPNYRAKTQIHRSSLNFGQPVIEFRLFRLNSFWKTLRSIVGLHP